MNGGMSADGGEPGERRSAVRDFWRTLRPCRWSAISLVFGAVVLFQSQVQDLLRAVADHLPHRSARIVQLLGAVAVWGHTNWYFARVMLYFRFPDTPPPSPRLERMATWTPRLLGTAAMLAFGIACFVAAGPLGGPAAEKLHALGAEGLGLGAAFLAFVYFRRPVSRRIGRRRLPMQPSQNDDAQLARLAPATWAYLSIWIAVGTALLVTFWVAAPRVAPIFGPLALVLLTASFWVPLGSATVYVGSRFQIPVLGALFAVWIVFSSTTDDHAIRTIADGAPAAAGRPVAVADAFAGWRATQQGPGRAPGSPPLPIFFVSAEGGGLRAAYWTSKVLSGLEDDNPSFADHLFAVSSVSGGSLGAVVFDALLAERRSGNLPADRTFADQAKGVLGEDFLSPVLAALLYPDAIVHFIPGSAVLTSADRARALEAAFEASWRAHVGTDRLSRPFRELWQGPAGTRLPHLLLNTTCTETGRRFVVSDLQAAPRVGDVSDALPVVGGDVPLSTAAHMSARFPYVSPGGRVLAHPEICGHFVDGGYFEDSGAATLLDLIQALPDQDQGQVAWVPVVIAINNDPDRDRPEPPLGFLSELLVPIRDAAADAGCARSLGRDEPAQVRHRRHPGDRAADGMHVPRRRSLRLLRGVRAHAAAATHGPGPPRLDALRRRARADGWGMGRAALPRRAAESTRAARTVTRHGEVATADLPREGVSLGVSLNG